jgi:hypothetical protein
LGFLIIIPVLHAQDYNGDNTVSIDDPILINEPEIIDEPVPLVSIDESEIVYVIRGFDFNVEGITQPYYLILNGEFREGERIQGKENFDRYLARKVQLLNNQRVLDDTATRIEYFAGESEDDGAIPTRLLIHVKDTMNFIILPYPKYDSNDGFSITLKARDYNFLGTMSPLSIDLGYKLDNDNRHSFNFMINSDTPFRALGLDWNINFDHSFEYTMGGRLYYQNVTGLSVRIPGSVATTIGFNHYLTFNEKIGSSYYDPYGATELFVSWFIPLGLEVGDFGQLYYAPRLSGKISYPYGQMNDARKPVTTLSHSIGFGRIDWIGNLRKGLSASIGNANSFYFDRSDNAPLAIRLDVDAAFYWAFNDIIGFSSRLKYRQLWWQWSRDPIIVASDGMLGYLPARSGGYPISGAGDYIRGVPNNNIYADYMLSLNLDFPIRVLRFWPSEWFNNDRLRYFNFEMYFSPFFDLALAKGIFEGSAITFNLDNMIKTFGLEVIVYPAIMRSLQIRGSIGYDIDKIRKNGLSLMGGFFPKWHEIYIGVDLYY